MPRPLARRRSFIVVGLAVFVASRYVPAIVSSWSGSPVPDEFRNDPSFFWTILLMDVGIVVPAAVAVAVGLIRGTRSAARAMFALVGWFTLVPPSVAAMAVAMVVNNDENASVGGMVLFLVAAAAFAGFAVSVYRPLFHPRPSRTSDRPSGA